MYCVQYLYLECKSVLCTIPVLGNLDVYYVLYELCTVYCTCTWNVGVYCPPGQDIRVEAGILDILVTGDALEIEIPLLST